MAMFLTLQSIAIIALFGWCISLTASVNKSAKESVEEANKRNDQQVQLILSILRPDIVEMKEQVNASAKQIDTAANAIQQFTEKQKK